jgi:tripartite ATP-independent transporter DctP family solute receptor
MRAIAFWLSVVAAWIAWAVAPPPASAQAYKPEFKNSLVTNDQTSWGQSAIRFAELLRERTQGRVVVKNYWSGRLFAGRQTNEFTLLNQGVADFAFGSTINWSPQVKELNLFNLPFFFPSYRALDAVEEGEPGQRLFKTIEAKGVIPLAWGENGYRELTNNKRAIRKPEDLAGLKIRVVGSPLFIDTFRALGAKPVDMDFGQALRAFQQGTVDGQENPIVNVITPYKLWTSQKHITLWHYTIDPMVIAVSKRTWEGLSPTDREAIRKTAVEVAAAQKAEARKGLDGTMDALETLRKGGMEVVTLTPAELAAFRERTRAVVEKWTGQIGPDLVHAAEQIIARTP